MFRRAISEALFSGIRESAGAEAGEARTDAGANPKKREVMPTEVARAAKMAIAAIATQSMAHRYLRSKVSTAARVPTELPSSHVARRPGVRTPSRHQLLRGPPQFHLVSGAQVPRQHRGGHLLVLALPFWGEEVGAKQEGEGVGVGAVEITERHHDHVEVKGIDAGADLPFVRAAAEELLHERHERRADDRSLGRAAQEPPAQEVLPAEEGHQLGMGGEVLVDEVEQLQEPLHRVDLVDLQAQLFQAQLPDHMFEHGHVEPAFVAEVVIEHPGVGARPLADSLYPRAAVAVGRELADSGAEDLFPGSVCVPFST